MLSWVMAVSMQIGASIKTYVDPYAGIMYRHSRAMMLPAARVFAGDVQLSASRCLALIGSMCWRLICGSS